jgi:hypothetical protein
MHYHIFCKGKKIASFVNFYDRDACLSFLNDDGEENGDGAIFSAVDE